MKPSDNVYEFARSAMQPRKSKTRALAILALLSCAFVQSTPSLAGDLTEQVLTCPQRAVQARSIAVDRDAGMSRAQEMHKIHEALSGAPQQQQISAGALMSVLVQRIYGMYTDLPPQKIYTGYLQYCRSHPSGSVRAP